MADLISLTDTILTPTEKTTVTTKVADIDTAQATYISKNPKYLQTKETDLGDMKYEVHELYKPSTEEKGYVTIFRKFVDKKEYIKTVGYGLDSKANTHDWIEVKEEPFYSIINK